MKAINLKSYYFRASTMSGEDFGGFSCDAVCSEAAWIELHGLIETTWPDKEIHLEECTRAEYFNWLENDGPKCVVCQDRGCEFCPRV
jgi:hypothetical protein